MVSGMNDSKSDMGSCMNQTSTTARSSREPGSVRHLAVDSKVFTVLHCPPKIYRPLVWPAGLAVVA